MAKQTFSVGQVLTAAQMTSLQQTAMLGGSATAKTTSYTLVAADAGTVVSVNSTSATTITVNTGLFAAGDTVTIQNWGSGSVTITAGTATVNTAGSLIVPQYDGGVLYFTSASAAIYFDWVQAGATSPLTTKGDIWGYSTSDARIPVGADATVLTADSTQALGVKWATPASGGYTELATGTLSGASTTISGISGSYKDLILYVYDYVISSTGGAAFLRINGSSSADYHSTGVVMEGSAGTAVYTNTGGTSEAFTGYGGSTVGDQHTTFIFYDYAQAVAGKNYQVIGTSFNSGNSRFSVKNGSGSFNQTSAITSLVIHSGSNTFSAGTYYLYGVK